MSQRSPSFANQTQPSAQRCTNNNNKNLVANPCAANGTGNKTKKRKVLSGSLSQPGRSSKLKKRDLATLQKSFSDTSLECTSRSESTGQSSRRTCSTLSYSSSSQRGKSEYGVLAQRFGIKRNTARKYHKILTNGPKVAIVRIPLVKREIVSPFSSPPRFQNLAPQKQSKSRRKKIPKIKIKIEPPGPDGIPKVKKMSSNNTSKETKDHLENKPIKREVKSPQFFNTQQSMSPPSKIEVTPKNSPLLRNMKFNTGSSEEEFEDSKSQSKSKSKQFRNPFANPKILNNPMARNVLNTPTTQSLRNKDKLSKNYGSNDKNVTKKNLNAFTIKSEPKSDNETNGDAQIIDNDKSTRVVDKNGVVVLKKKNRHKEKMKNIKLISFNGKIISQVQKSLKNKHIPSNSGDSMLVNCQEDLSPKKNEIKQVNDGLVNGVSKPKSLRRFGEGSSDENQNKKHIIDVELDKVFAKKNRMSNSIDTNNKLHTLNESITLLDSPTKLDLNAQKTDVKSSTPEEVSAISKGKPRITSDFIIPKKKSNKTNQKNIPPSNPVNSENSGPNSTSTSSKLKQIAFNGAQKNSQNPIVPTISSPILGSSKRKNSSNNKTSVLKQNLKAATLATPVTDTNFNDSIEENFFSLCEDVYSISNTESITLHKGDASTSNGDNSKKIVMKLSNSNTQDTEIQKSLNTSEQQSLLGFNDNSSMSPVIRRSSNRLSLKNLKSPTFVNETHQPLRPSTPNSGVNIDGSQIIQPTTPTSRDPRINRFISPMKTPNSSSRDPRINRSLSPDSLANSMDATSSISENSLSKKDLNSSNDPRIRKRQVSEDSGIATKMMKLQKSDSQSPTALSTDAQTEPNTPIRSSIHSRIGRRPSKGDELNEPKNDQPPHRKSTAYESDYDDAMSMCAPDDSFLETSDNESGSSSPRDRKFTSERVDIDEEMSYTPAEPKKPFVRQKPLFNDPKFNSSSVMGPPSTSRVTNKLNIKQFTNHQSHQQQPRQSSFQAKSGEAAMYGQYKNNDNYKKFEKMNERQMMSDEQNLRTQQFEKGRYIAAHSVNDGQASMLDTINKPPIIGLNSERCTFFQSFCFTLLKEGECPRDSGCRFSHNIQHLLTQVKLKNVQLLQPILDFAIKHQYDYFLKHAWSMVLPALQNESFNYFQKLYNNNRLTESIFTQYLEYCTKDNLVSVEAFVKQISPIIKVGDRNTVKMVCSAIKKELRDGFCWETIKDLSAKAVPPLDFIQIILMECLQRKKSDNHIQEVFHLVENQMSVTDRDKIESLLKKFSNLIGKSNYEEAHQKQSLNGIENQRLRSNDRSKQSPQDSNSDVTRNMDPKDSPLPETSLPKKGVSMNNIKWNLTNSEPTEAHSVFRDRFWKLYVHVNGVEQGLAHKDYAFVWKVLNDFSREEIENELLRQAYYHILCKDVMKHENYINQIIHQAVKSGESSERSKEALFDVGLAALVELANADLWIMADNVLRTVKILEPKEPRIDFILISAEIYIANGDPVEALYLLQKTRIIRNNRDEWLVKDSEKRHEQLRNDLVSILLQGLMYNDLEKAVYLFSAILKDQYIYSYPIDLPIYLDKLVLLLIYYNKLDLVIEMSRLVMCNDLSFQKEVYRDIITYLLPVDEQITKQLFEYAIQLGYYSDIQIKTGFTTILIDISYNEEELYLLLNRLIDKLKVDVGPVIENLRPSQLKVIFMFEDIPNMSRRSKNEINLSFREDKYKTIKCMVKTILETRFFPKIMITNRKTPRGLRLLSKSLVNHLKHWCLNN